MDEAEKYQQRLQAIAERRRQQEEEKRLTRETEEEWLKTAQEKRKYLRDQWLSETPPVLAALDNLRPHRPLRDEADKHSTAETRSQKTPEDVEEQTADPRKEKQASQEENKESVNCTARTLSHYQAGTDEDLQVNKEAEDHFSIQMAQRMFHESGQEGRSVLGMLAVQVERDPKTGATIVRSVAPVSAPAGGPAATTVFDDGRKSIQAVGGSGSQPSTEELGQILRFVDGVGMKVLLDEVTPSEAETKIANADANRAPEGKVLSFSTPLATSKEENTQSNSSRSYKIDAALGTEDCAVSMGNKEDKKEDGSIMAVRDITGEVENMEDLSLEEGPVTLVFLGYTDADQAQSQEDHEAMITVERVIITEEGEEHVLGPQTHASPQVGKESQVFQDIPLDGNGAGVQREEGDKELHNSSSPSKAEGGGGGGGGTPKRKTCQCCSVM
ncbi:paralemmin-2-like isoform X2 [Cottoperca gobio]|nr:paralemmin-2-like isoform X2 [Cottoperca gobio]XP_029292671.1 paralemmin-2-like isoform X2 [Cottoperca gobio]